MALLVGDGTKGRRGFRMGEGFWSQDGHGGGEQGGEKNVGCQAWVMGWVVRGEESGNGFASEKRRGVGPVCSAFEG